MSVAKNIEVSSTSAVSFEDAIEQATSKVCKTVKNVQGAWVKEQKVSIKDGKISAYHVIMIVSFVLGEGESAS